MGRAEHFEVTNQPCGRRELDAFPPVNVVTRTAMIRFRNQEYQMTVTCWTGRHLLELGGEKIDVVQTCLADGGPKLGVSLNFVRWEDCAEEERAANRERVRRAAETVFSRRCFWNEEEGASKEEEMK